MIVVLSTTYIDPLLFSAVTHLSDQKYTICFRREAGYCAICYTPSIQQGAIATSPIDGQGR